jgi:hypothetical protein
MRGDLLTRTLFGNRKSAQKNFTALSALATYGLFVLATSKDERGAHAERARSKLRVVGCAELFYLGTLVGSGAHSKAVGRGLPAALPSIPIIGLWASRGDHRTTTLRRNGLLVA